MLVTPVGYHSIFIWIEWKDLKLTQRSKRGNIPTRGKCGRYQTMRLQYCWLTTASQELCSM
jgi:hypothetical protein